MIHIQSDKCALCGEAVNNGANAGLPACDKHSTEKFTNRFMEILKKGLSDGGVDKYIESTLAKSKQ